jgi:hypothetical protein
VNPRTRLVLYTVLGAVLGIVIGVDVAGESYGLATLIVLISAWLIVNRLSEAAPDAWLLAAILVGYVVGNRGFAQIQPAQLIPLLPAEAVLLVAVPALLLRMALKQATGFRRDALNCTVLAWVALGLIRLPLDMNRYGVMALRDFAMIYYAAFFFIAQSLGSQAASRKVLTRALTVAFVALLPVVVSILISPDFLVDNLTLRGIPIIYHKSDLIATSLAAGFFWLWSRWDRSHGRAWLALAAASLLLVGVMASPRAGMFAIGVTTLLWLLTGRWRMAAFQVGIVAAASVVAVAATSLSGRDLRTSVPYSMYEHAVSFFDPAGTGTYINNESGDLGGNNQFRLIWWRDVVEDTVAANPILGLGFGADLSARFLVDFDLLSDETFAARSPHSMIVTVIGRMGFLGLAAWIAVSASIAVMVWRLLKAGDPDGMGLASVVAVIWLSACFGVVLEGPMGAVIFWTVLGLANSRLRLVSPPVQAHSGAGRGEGEQGERPVANAGTSGTESVPR